MYPKCPSADLQDVLFLLVALLKDLIRHYQIGEHLLLIGNQGVGKNKVLLPLCTLSFGGGLRARARIGPRVLIIFLTSPQLADRLLELMGKEREYMQLHRLETSRLLTAPSREITARFE
jgi:DNA replication protein DnaC